MSKVGDLFRKPIVLQIGLLVLGLVMIGFGVARGEARDVLEKAVVICLSCIGIN